MKVQVKVNELGALRNGRYAFTDKFTLISELIQNARRAGASEVSISYDDAAQRLVVADNGTGIEDFGSLLHFNASGWNESTSQAEHPFGLGFSKCLYAASHVHITSRGKSLEFDCADALAQHELEVCEAVDAPLGFSVITLDGVDLPALGTKIDRITRGFPIPVIFNGVTQPRLHAPGNMHFVETDIGLVHIAGRDNGKHATGTAVYLQGLLVGDSSRDYYNCHSELDVVHLDSAKFMARMPDRTELIDAPEQRSKIAAAIHGEWEKILATKKAELPAERFVETYFRQAAAQNLVRVFDDVPLVPRQACWEVVVYPNLSDGRLECMAHPDEHATPAAMETKTVKLAAFTPYINDEEEDDLVSMMYARAASITLVEPEVLGESHWVRQGLRDLNAEEVVVSPVGPTIQAEFKGLWVSVDVQLCQSIEIRHGADVVQISDEALFVDGRILFPSGCEEGDVVKQVETYRGDYDVIDDTACEEDMTQLVRMVLTLRCPDPASMLKSLLRQTGWSQYSSLAGKSFKVTLSGDTEEAMVDLVS